MPEACESIVDYLLLKLAARCNLNCTYCYWFRDPEVLQKPPVMKRETLALLASRLGEHVARYSLKKFSILFHGGEPLLCRKDDFDFFCSALQEITEAQGCQFNLKMTTNGLLIDDGWIELFERYCVGITLSIDGPKDLHDASRVDLKGRGTFDRTIEVIDRLRSRHIEPGILSVCSPLYDPSDILRLIVDDLGFDGFDILIPDARHGDDPPSIARFYKKLFDLWLEDYDSRGVSIRFLDNILLGLFGGFSESESIGYGPIRRLTVLTDGSLETLDVLRILGPGFTSSALNLSKNQLQDIETDPLWNQVLNASLQLSAECEACSYRTSCGGGHIATRWREQTGFDNPSVYCGDIKDIFRHIWGRVSPNLTLVPLSREVKDGRASAVNSFDAA